MNYWTSRFHPCYGLIPFLCGLNSEQKPGSRLWYRQGWADKAVALDVRPHLDLLGWKEGIEEEVQGDSSGSILERERDVESLAGWLMLYLLIYWIFFLIVLVRIL